MKLFGIECKFNGFDIWHSGNFNPASKSNIEHTHDIDALNRKMLTGSTVSAAYFTFAETPANTLDYDAIFKITIDSTVNASIRHSLIVRVTGNGTSVPKINVQSSIYSASASNSGIRYIRVCYPKSIGNGYKTQIELYTYDSTSRNITIELLTAKNVSLLDSLTASSYNSTYQSTALSASLYYTGDISGTYYGIFSGNASSASYAASLYTSSFMAGDALVANDLIYLGTDDKWYKAIVPDKAIPMGTLIARCASTYAIGVTVGAYLQGRYSLPTGVTGLTDGQDAFLKGMINGSLFISDGTVTNTLSAGYDYMRVGAIANGQIYYNGNNRVYSVSHTGTIDSIDNLKFNAIMLNGNVADDFAKIVHTHFKIDITDMPTKLSEFVNDIGAGGGVTITTADVAPSEPSPGDFWYQVI